MKNQKSFNEVVFYFPVAPTVLATWVAKKVAVVDNLAEPSRSWPHPIHIPPIH